MLNVAKKEQLQKKEMARQKEERAKVQARLDSLKYEWEAKEKVAWAEALQAKANHASLSFDPGQLEKEN